MQTTEEGNKPNCSRHLKSVAGISDMKELATLVGDLHYESLHEFLFALANKINTDANKDRDSGRKTLSAHLVFLRNSLLYAAKCAKDVWEHCKPFMSNTSPVNKEQ